MVSMCSVARGCRSRGTGLLDEGLHQGARRARGLEVVRAEAVLEALQRQPDHGLGQPDLGGLDVTLNGGIENVFDRDPAGARLEYGYDPFIGSAIGRTFRLGTKVRF